MRESRWHPRLARSVLGALAAAGIAGCSGGGDPEPAEVRVLCDVVDDLNNLALDVEWEFIAERERYSNDGVVQVVDREGRTAGERCASATDASTCLEALASTWPETDTGTALVYTIGDAIELVPESGLPDLLGEIDSPTEALMLASPGETCESPIMAFPDGHFEWEVWVGTTGCRDQYVIHSVTPDGTVSTSDITLGDDTGACDGRRPNGLRRARPVIGSPVARHLAQVARLEAAAVVAFRDLVADLRRLGAPGSLVARALDALEDEARHACAFTTLARRAGAEPAPIEVDVVPPPDLEAFAWLNAVEGCAREAFGVVDAAYRSHRAADPALRALYARVAEDETRHAALSWDIADWVEPLLTPAARERVIRAREAAFDALAEELREKQVPEEERILLGAPTAEQAVAMVRALHEGLGAERAA